VTFKLGLVHAPLTPFADGRIDYATYGKLLDFHIRHGAEGLALPMHAGESVSLSAGERQELLQFAVRHVGGRVPVIAHVSEAGTAIAASLAAHAREAGAAALIATVPYYWTPPQHMLVEHFAAIGKAGGLPFFVLNAPSEMADVEFAPKSVVELIHKLPEFAGLIDTSLDWQYMIEVVTVARAERSDFQFVSGTEYMISAGAIGATGLLSPLAGITPHLVHELYKLCRSENYAAARPLQEDAAILFRLMRDAGVAGLKAGSRMRGRPCGDPRPPLVPWHDNEGMFAALCAIKSLKDEPHGWN
jgi:dihydrodipicolinate synthase/N-acetylneuraminate lyase